MPPASRTWRGDSRFSVAAVVVLVLSSAITCKVRGQDPAVGDGHTTQSPPTPTEQAQTLAAPDGPLIQPTPPGAQQPPIPERTSGATRPGVWGNWGAWSQCSASCGRGSHARTRSCLHGVCMRGSTMEIQSCDVAPCPAPGVLGEQQWSQWSQCSVTCGGGTSSRRRCTTPQCTSHDQNTQRCNTDPCPPQRQTSDTRWSQWSSWGPCNTECITERRRTCLLGTGSCPKDESNTGLRRCLESPCTNSWHEWGSWSSCSATCGSGGERRRSRSCPRGAEPRCAGSRFESESCSGSSCAPPPTFSPWTTWTTCSGQCNGVGSQSRDRACEGSASSGRCTGNTVDQRSCRVAPCGAPRAWTQWSAWSRCSSTCDGGTRRRQRTCPSGTGPVCPGDSQQSEPCSTNPCSPWSTWSDWSACSRTCGRGQASRNRRCLAASGCSPGQPDEYRSCYMAECESGRWQEWGLWSRCSVSCGVGNSVRTRDCAQGLCNGHTIAVRDCQPISCEGSPWAEWSRWSACSISCGLGHAKRERACLGLYCVGSLREVRQCADRACPGATLPIITTQVATTTRSAPSDPTVGLGDAAGTGGGPRQVSGVERKCSGASTVMPPTVLHTVLLTLGTACILLAQRVLL